MTVTPVFSESQIARRVSELGIELRRDAGNEEIFVIGILKGTSVFLGDLLRRIPGEVHYQWVNVITDVADTETAEATEINFLTQFDVRGKNIYILKDVVTTGVIDNYLMTQFRQREPKELKLVALLDIPEARRLQLNPEFRAFTAQPGTFVGYGLESRERYGNLPFIGLLP